ncbi:hypothetical protein ACP70R_032050 [Stipagrostis hirtigluma subsp. patula]
MSMPWFAAGGRVSAALRGTLAGLEASTPVCVCTKDMMASDRDGAQNRLLMSCKKNKRKIRNGERVYFADILTEKETTEVHRAREPEQPEIENKGDKDKRKRGGDDNGKHKKKKEKKSGGKDKGKDKKMMSGGEEKVEDEKPEKNKSGGEEKGEDEEAEKEDNELGLAVRAYDGDGRPYDLRLRYLPSNQAYRIIGKHWKRFLQSNGLLLLRKSRSDGRSSSPDEEPDGDRLERDDDDPVRIQLWAFRSRRLTRGENDHPDGKLGLVLLHYRDEGEGAAQVDADDGAGAEELPEAGEDAAVRDPIKRHGHDAATRDEGLRAHRIPAADGAGDVQEEGVAVVRVASGDVGEAAPRARREPGLTPVEVFYAQSLLLFNVRYCKQRNANASARCTCKQGPKCICS